MSLSQNSTIRRNAQGDARTFAVIVIPTASPTSAKTAWKEIRRDIALLTWVKCRRPAGKRTAGPRSLHSEASGRSGDVKHKGSVRVHLGIEAPRHMPFGLGGKGESMPGSPPSRCRTLLA